MALHYHVKYLCQKTKPSTPWNITMIKDKSQGSVAPCLRRGKSFDYYYKFTAESSFKEILVSIWISHRHSVHCRTVQPKDKLARDQSHYITLRQQASMTVSGIDEYQTGVLVTTSNSLTDTVSDWLNDNRFFFVAAGEHSQSFRVC